MSEPAVVYETSSDDSNMALAPLGIIELTEANLRTMAAQAQDLTIDLETGKGYPEVRAAHIQVKGYSTQIKQRLDELNKPLNEQRRRNNELAAKLNDVIKPIIDTLEAKRLAWEDKKAAAKAAADKAETDRVASIRAKIDQMADIPTTISGMYDSAGIMAVANEIKNRAISIEEYFEFADEARKTRDRAYLTLLAMHDTLLKTEREEAEQAAIRADLEAKRKEQEVEAQRLEDIRKSQEAKEKADRDKIEAERMKAENERLCLEAEKKAEADRIEREAREAEEKRIADEAAKAKAEEDARLATEEAQRLADETKRKAEEAAAFEAFRLAEIERLKPDFQRMIEWANDLLTIESPVFVDERFQTFALDIVKVIHGTAVSLRKYAEEAIGG